MKLEALIITITGTVGSSGKYLVTGIPVVTTANAVLKIAFENNTFAKIEFEWDLEKRRTRFEIPGVIRAHSEPIRNR